MKKDFEQLSIKQGFMKHNGGLFYRQISETESEFKASVNEYHLNAAGITHGGYIASIIDAGAGTGAHRTTDGGSCVTVSLDIKFIGATKLGDKIKGFTKIQKKTKNMIFLICYLESNGKMIASASGIWKIMKN
jgi:uncharacterized protein (TIGR00369 family)